jgi:hypothetical protein
MISAHAPHATHPNHLGTLSLRIAAPRPRLILAGVALLVGVALALAGAPIASAHALADSHPTGHAVRLASPAVVRFVTVEQAQVICTGCASDGGDLTLPSSGNSYYSGSMGSGALISPDGYILTADHVVDVMPGDDATFIANAAPDFAQAKGISLTDAQNELDALNKANRLNVPITVKSAAYLSTAYWGHLSDDAQSSRSSLMFPVTRIAAQSPVLKDDVAIVKIEAQDLPNLTLAPAGSTHAQDSVTAIAFPGDADVGDGPYDKANDLPLFDPSKGNALQFNNLLTPTVEDGQIIAVKQLANGMPDYEASSIGNHGSSGGPVVNTEGQIVGFVDRLSSDSTATTRLMNLVSSEAIAPYVKQAGVTRSGQGSFMTRWTAAMNAYDAGDGCRWAEARDDLGRLQQDYPRFGGVASYLSEATRQASSARCFPGSGLLGAGPEGLILPLLSLGLALGAIGGVILVWRRNPSVRPAFAAAARAVSSWRMRRPDGWSPWQGRPAQAGGANMAPAVGGYALPPAYPPTVPSGMAGLAQRPWPYEPRGMSPQSRVAPAPSVARRGQPGQMPGDMPGGMPAPRFTPADYAPYGAAVSEDVAAGQMRDARDAMGLHAEPSRGASRWRVPVMSGGTGPAFASVPDRICARGHSATKNPAARDCPTCGAPLLAARV